MAFIESTVGGLFNNTTVIGLLTGASAGSPIPRRVVKTVVIHNKDTVARTITLSLEINTVLYQMFKITLQPGDTLVQDVPVALKDNTYILKGVLDGAITSAQPTFVVTYAEVS